MVSLYSLNERKIRYNLLLITSDPSLTIAATREFNKENVGVVSTSEIKEYENYVKKGEPGEYLGVVVDLDTSRDLNNITLGNVVGIRKTCFLTTLTKKDKELSKIYKSYPDSIIIYSGTNSDYFKQKIMVEIRKRLFNPSPGIFSVSKKYKPLSVKHNVFKNFQKLSKGMRTLKIPMFLMKLNPAKLALFMFSILISLPYILCAYLLVLKVSLKYTYPSRIHPSSTINYLYKNLRIRENVLKLNSFYSETPIIGNIYRWPEKYALSERYLVVDLLDFSNNVLYVSSFFDIQKYDTSVDFSKKSHLKEKDDLKDQKTFKKFGIDVSDFIFSELLSDNLKSLTVEGKNNNVLLLVKNNNEGTLTGGVVENIYLLKLGNGKVEVSATIDPNVLKGSFLGNMNDTSFVGEAGNLIDDTFAAEDQLRVLKRLIKYTQNVDVVGLVSVNNESINNLRALHEKLKTRKAKFSDVLDYIQILRNELENKNVSVYLEQGIGDVNLALLSDDRKSVCQHNKLTLFNLFKNSNDPNIDISIVGNELEDKITLTLFYSSGSSTEKLVLEIPERDLIETSLKQDRFHKLTKLRDIDYLEMEIIPNREKVKLVEISLNKNVCKTGWGIDIKKQEGQSHMFLNYDMGLLSEKYIFLNGSLTKRGDRLYNSELVSFDKDLLFEVVNDN